MIKPTKSELDLYDAYYRFDTDFAAHARLLQSKWRHKKQYQHSKYGNLLDATSAKAERQNFLTDNIKQLVSEEVSRSGTSGAMIGEPRIWNNLLSSQPLCFNLFGELHFDLELATKYFKRLFPNRIDKVLSVKFEYSSGRGNVTYTGDHSAFDVFIEYEKSLKKGFIGIEVKYAESLLEEPIEKAEKTFSRHRTRYTELTTTSNIFKSNAIYNLMQVPLSQIWRDHLLAIAHKKDYDEGIFVFLFPKQNEQCQHAVTNYVEYLISNNEEETGFCPRYLEDFIQTLQELHSTEWTKELKERYLGSGYEY